MKCQHVDIDERERAIIRGHLVCGVVSTMTRRSPGLSLRLLTGVHSQNVGMVIASETTILHI